MGSPPHPFNAWLQAEYGRWHLFRRALRKEDQGPFDELFARASVHMENAAAANWYSSTEMLIMCILIEMHKDIMERSKELGIPLIATAALPAAQGVFPGMD